MASNFAASKAVFLKRVRLDFNDLWQPGEPMSPADKANKAKWKYKAVVIIDRDSPAAKAAKEGLIEAAAALWGDNAVQMLKSIPKNSKALRNGDEYLDDKGNLRPNYAGKLYLSASNKEKPQVIAPAKHNGMFVNIGEDGNAYVEGRLLSPPPYKIIKPYRGCWVNLKVVFVAGKADPSKNLPNQVYAKLEGVQFVEDGEAFGPGPTSAEGFEDEEVASGSGGSAADLDDDIAF